MRKGSVPLRLGRDERGASAVEFALVLPVFLLFLLGIIDVGRFIWAVNENEKAVQIGARWAVTTDMICSGLESWSFALNQSSPIAQGSSVPQSAFPGVIYPGGSATSCQCVTSGCEFPMTADTGAFLRLVNRMYEIQPRVRPENVSVAYLWSGLGYSGDPNGADVAPMVTVTLQRMDFRPLIFAGFLSLGIPGAQYSLTMEDGDGVFGN